MTPYGYRIVDGRAVVDDVQASTLIRFFDLFLSGSPMSTAAKEAGIPACPSSYPALFYKPAYIGTDFYPAIITQSYQLQLQLEYKRRRASSRQGEHTCRRKSVPIHTQFRLRYPAPADIDDPVSALYSRIRPAGPRPSAKHTCSERKNKI